MPPIRVVIADDHLLFRAGIVSLFSGQPDFEVVGEAANGAEAIQMVQQLSPDLLLLDVRMPGVSGLAVLQQIRDQNSDVHVVMLTASEDDDDLLASVKSGAQGYLLKNTAPAELFARLRGVMLGEAAISGTLAARLLRELSRESKWGRGATVLSEREAEVLRLVAEGASNREIAAQLTITENTVKKHLQSILEKLHLENRTQAAAYALRMGLDKDSPPKSSST
jgi:DNA-binding NarL/FixJ family response regulator